MKVFITEGSYLKNTSFLLKESHEQVSNIFDAELVIFTGGLDVSPSLYGQEEGAKTVVNKLRDEREERYFRAASQFNIPMLGICRGAQFLTVMNGGILIQDVNNHHGIHKIIDVDGSIMESTSSHHQMMYPYLMRKSEYRVLARTLQSKSTYYMSGDNFHFKVDESKNLDNLDPRRFSEPEIVYYPETNCLCVQGHPESMKYDSKLNVYLRNIIKDMTTDKEKLKKNEESFCVYSRKAVGARI